MLAIERRNEILEKLQAERRVVVSDLSKLYKVSEETIRRDLEKLEDEGFAIKSYGGAVINENSNLDLPFNIRKNRAIVEKQAIAGLAAAHVREEDTIILDASSTSVYIAKALKVKKKLTVITNSVEIVLELFDKSDWNVISTGGQSRQGSLALVGPKTDSMLRTYGANIAFISSRGVSLESGLTDSDELHANNKLTMLTRAKEKVLVADNSKFDKTGFTTICPLGEIDTLITDKKPEPRWMEILREQNVNCIYPGSEESSNNVGERRI